MVNETDPSFFLVRTAQGRRERAKTKAPPGRAGLMRQRREAARTGSACFELGQLGEDPLVDAGTGYDSLDRLEGGEEPRLLLP